MKRVLAVYAVAVLIAVAGCGSTAGTSATDPATLAPPGTLAFATFDLTLPGSAHAAFEKLLGPAPQAKLGAAFTKAAQTSGKLDYLGDVRPWLGNSLSVAITRVGPRDCDFALLAASTDDEKAQAAIDKDLAGVHAETRTYREVTYKLLDDGTANGIVSHFLVAGSEATFKQVVDAAKDGDSLADSGQWKKTVADRGEGKAGLAYLDAKGLLQSFAVNVPGPQRVAAPVLLGMVPLDPFVATLDADPDTLVVDVSSPGTKPDARGPDAASSPLIETMPAQAWFALALPDVGQALGKAASALKANPLIASQYARISEAFRARTGLDLDKDLLTLGDVGVFARGSTPSTVRGTLVVQSRPATLRRLRALVDSRTNHRVTVMPPPAALDRLGRTPLFEKATAAIGARPTVFVDFGPALELAASSPHHRSDARFQHALPRLRHVEYVAAGARREDGLDVLRGVIGLR